MSDLPTTANGVSLVRRKITPAEAKILHHELKTTPNILGYTPGELKHFSDVIVAEIDSTFAGVCISKNLLWNWTDIAVIYVLPAFRGKGIATELFAAAFQAARERKRHIYTLSRSPHIIRLMERYGMEIVSMSRMPAAVYVYNQYHMLSLYRWWEVFRKLRYRIADGNRFVAGQYRHSPH